MVADQTANRKSAKYVDFAASHIFQPVAAGKQSLFNSSALSFLDPEGGSQNATLVVLVVLVVLLNL